MTTKLIAKKSASKKPPFKTTITFTDLPNGKVKINIVYSRNVDATKPSSSGAVNMSLDVIKFIAAEYGTKKQTEVSA